MSKDPSTIVTGKQRSQRSNNLGTLSSSMLGFSTPKRPEVFLGPGGQPC